MQKKKNKTKQKERVIFDRKFTIFTERALLMPTANSLNGRTNERKEKEKMG